MPVAEPPPLKTPFPYAGGKARIADVVWERFGDGSNYVEPFAGGLSVLLRRPAEHFADGYRVETLNDANHYVVNFWRCLAQGKAAEVAAYADWPVMEADLHARHRWLVRSDESHGWRTQFAQDPHFCDVKIAGWWVWGQCCWIGGAWCHDGYAREDYTQRPAFQQNGLGWGINAAGDMPMSMPKIGHGTNGGNATASFIGTRDSRRAWLVDWMQRLADRLRLVRTCYGHWNRICDSESTLRRLGITAAFLDPPYPTHSEGTGKKSRDGSLYATDKHSDLNALRDEVRDWCLRWGGEPLMRVAVCCYEGDGYEVLEKHGWDCFEWETGGGYSNQRRGGLGKGENATRERIYFSPWCLRAKKEPTLLDGWE